MSAIEVGMNEYRTGKSTQTLYTQGIGVTVYGLPPVQASGMVDRGWVISKADPTVNDSLTDAQLKEELRELVTEQHLTKEFLKGYRENTKVTIQTSNKRATDWYDSLGGNGKKITRNNSNFFRGDPCGTMQAIASPGGEVYVEGRKKANIPDSQTGAAMPRRDRSEKRRGHTSGTHTARGHYDDAGSSSSASRRAATGGNNSTSGKAVTGGSSSTTKKECSGSRR